MDKGFLNNFGRKDALYSHVHTKIIEEQQRIAIWDKRLEFFWIWGKWFNLYMLVGICLYIVALHLPLIVLLIQILLQYNDIFTGFLNVFEPFTYIPTQTPYRLVDYNKLFWANVIKVIEHSKCNSFHCTYYHWLALTFG